MYTVCQGTTPILTWDIPYDAEAVAAADVTIQQYGRTLITRSLKDCRMEGKQMSVTLTQEETLGLDHRCTAKIQATIRAIDKTTVRTCIDSLEIVEALKKEPI